MNHYPIAILFDWDGTLVPPTKIMLEIERLVKSTYKQLMNHSLSPEKIERVGNMSMRESFPILFEDKAQEAHEIIKRTLADRRKELRDKPKLFPGVLEVLKFINDNGIYTAIVSNKEINKLQKEAEKLGVQKFFKKIIGAGSIHVDKPSALPLLESLKGTSIEPGKNVWMVGNAIVDYECAKNAKCQSFLLQSDSLKLYPNLDDAIIINNLIDLIRWIKYLKNK